MKGARIVAIRLIAAAALSLALVVVAPTLAGADQSSVPASSGNPASGAPVSGSPVTGAPVSGAPASGTSSLPNIPAPVQPVYNYVPSGVTTIGQPAASPTTSPARPLAEGLGLAALLIVLLLYTEGYGVLGGRILPLASRRRHRRRAQSGQDAGPTLPA